MKWFYEKPPYFFHQTGVFGNEIKLQCRPLLMALQRITGLTIEKTGL
jgi:hypothetical protein